MRRDRSLRRNPPKRLPKRKFIVFSEGKNTEPTYFRALMRTVDNTLLELEIVDAAGVPRTIADKAIERHRTIKRDAKRSSFEARDVVWAVFDRDEHPEFSESVQRCTGNGVGTGVSDPCFELWLILHIEDCDAPHDRHQIQKLLATKHGGYDPKGAKMVDCVSLLKRISDAEDRAEKQLARRLEEGTPIRRPYTTVFELTRALRSAANER